MNLTRPIAFWIAMLAAVITAVVLLREVLLPFATGMALAYLLDPLATRLERLGMSRLVATLTITGLLTVAIVGLIVLTAPFIISEMGYLVDDFPHYLRRLQGLAADPNRPWLSKTIGEGLGYAERSIGNLTALATDGFGDFLRSIWSGGQALVSVFSLAIVAPIVACYLTYDWNKMTAVVDNWVPPAQRDTVRELAREIDDTIGGFVTGQGALCLILALFYAVALSFAGLEHAIPIGVAAGLISFVPYLGALAGMAVATCTALAQLWPNWAHI
jgi:predicted PurR-regulated permease PerM